MESPSGCQKVEDAGPAQKEFFERKRRDGETSNEYGDALRQLVVRCNFGVATETIFNFRFSCEFPKEVGHQLLMELAEGTRGDQVPVFTRNPVNRLKVHDEQNHDEQIERNETSDSSSSTPRLLAERVANNDGREGNCSEVTEKTPEASQHRDERQPISATQDRGPIIWYKKTGGAATGAGESYEWKMLTLIFLRMLSAGLEFQLASNVKAAEKFDDIVLRHRKNPDVEWDISYLQLKHKLNKEKFITKTDLLGLSGDFSLVKYCDSYETMKLSEELNSAGKVNELKIIIFTTLGISDSFVDEVTSDSLLSTGGKAVSFKAGGEIFLELCELVNFKRTLVNLQGRVDGWSEKEIASEFAITFENLKYANKAVTSFKNELLKAPTLVKLKALLVKLGPVRDKEIYLSFLAKLQIYTNQTSEWDLDAKIKKEFGNVLKCDVYLEADATFNALLTAVKSWWQKDNFFLTQDALLWLSIVKLQTEFISKSTIGGLTKFGIKFVESSLRVLHDKIGEVGGIFNVRVKSSAAASSLRLHQAMERFGANINALHVNVKTLLDREIDIFAAWATRWCRVLVLECDRELNPTNRARIIEKILNVLSGINGNKLLVLIASEKHELNLQLYHAKTCYVAYEDDCSWSDLTEATKQNIFLTGVVLNGTQSQVTLSDLVGGNKEIFNKADMNVISQFVSESLCFGKDLYEESEFFVTRRLMLDSKKPFVVNSIREVHSRVVLVVAEPGMGKSTLVTHLANQAKAEVPTAWIVHIKLIDCAKYLASMNPKCINRDVAMKFVEYFALSSGNCLEKLVFRSLEHKLIVFIDGVDEVSPSYQRQIFPLLTFLKDFKYSKLWVASRALFESQLENALGVLAYHVDHFSKDDQGMFFNKVWKKKFPEEFKEMHSEAAENFLTFFNKLYSADNPLLGIPLIAAMVADMFEKQALAVVQGTGKFEMNETLNMISLYKWFVSKKFDRFCDEKKQVPNRENAANRVIEVKSMERIYRNHSFAALRVILSRKEIARLQLEGKDKFEDELKAYLTDLSDGLEKTGIINNVLKGIPQFIHYSFAEYFAASWLAGNYKTNPELTKRIIFDPAHKFLAEMFHLVLAENCPLHLAALKRDITELDRLLNDQHNVNELDAGGRTPLHLAALLSGTDCHEDYVTIVETLITKHKARVDIADKITGWTPTQYAEQVRSWQALEIFLANGNICSNDWPPADPRLLLDAARDASVTVVSYLVDIRGGKFKRQSPHGETMIHRAAEGGNVEMLKYLADKGLSFHGKDKRENTALHYSTFRDKVEVVHFLLEKGLDPNAVNRQGLTAFQEAAKRGAYKVMAVLLKEGASIESDKLSLAKSNVSLLCAAFAGDLDTIEQLLAKGADCYHQDYKGHTAAWVAMDSGHLDVMKWLLLQGSRDGDTPLHGACRMGEPEIVSFLISRTDIKAEKLEDQTMLPTLKMKVITDVDCRNNDGKTPLHVASLMGRKQVVELLLGEGASVDSEDGKGWTPLHAASWRGRLDVMELLIERGASVNHPSKDGKTPLHNASSWGSKQAVELLLRKGAIFNAKDHQGLTPLRDAEESNKVEVATLLSEMG